nr:integrase, catalytic region, zinc finger, CCHC-type, peptidase aspartic, catalytic [Tanacetum cinerariifolium]
VLDDEDLPHGGTMWILFATLLKVVKRFLQTRITSASVVPPKKTTSHSVETQKPDLKVYNKKPKNGKNVVRFGNDHIARIMGYGDYQLGNVTISRVYYVEGLGHNLFSVGQFCDTDLEVAFRKNTCFILPVAVGPRVVDLANSPVSTSIDQDAPSTSIPSTQDQEHSLIISQGFEESPKTPHFHYDLLLESLHEDSTSQGSSSNMRPIHTPFESLVDGLRIIL